MVGGVDSVLHDGYRRVDEDQESVPAEYKYSYESFLSLIEPNRTSSKRVNRRNLLSDIYTVSDEAFGLLVIHNELGVWGEQYKLQEEGKSARQLRINKKYAKHNSGESWALEGLAMYGALKLGIAGRGGERASVTLETLVRDIYRGDDPAMDMEHKTPVYKNLLEYIKKKRGQLASNE